MSVRWTIGVVLLGGAACSHAGSTVEIGSTRRASQPSSPVLPGASAADRFTVPQDGDAHDPGASSLAYDLPPGWQELPASGGRLIDLRPAGDPETSCYLAFLQGAGGGLVENVNRWRKQLGAQPLSESEVAALPTHTMLGREGTLVEVAGTYTGMGEAPREGYKLLGLIESDPSGSLFLKLTGPAFRVDAERENFLLLATTLHTTEGHVHGDTAPTAAPETPPGKLSWQVPAGWTEQPPRMMREVSFTVGTGGECYIARLGPGAGGLRANLDRWREQFGLSKLTDEELAALPPVKMLGLETPLLELEGSYAGMGGTAVPDQALLGAAVFRSADSLFVKFTGPAAVVRAERASFLAFLASLGEGA